METAASFEARYAPSSHPTTYRGQLLEVQIGLDDVEYRLREGERLTIRHEKQELELTREHPQVVRPISRI